LDKSRFRIGNGNEIDSVLKLLYIHFNTSGNNANADFAYQLTVDIKNFNFSPGQRGIVEPSYLHAPSGGQISPASLNMNSGQQSDCAARFCQGDKSNVKMIISVANPPW
jgi:hypothetical protein